MKGYVGKPFTSQELWHCLMKFFKPVGWQPLSRSRQSQADTELRRLLVKDFIKNSRLRFDEITSAIKAGDITLAHRLVHTLKGNAAQLGKPFLQHTAAEVEQNLENNKSLVTEEQLKTLEINLNTALVQFTEELLNEVSYHELQDESSPPDAKPEPELFKKLESLLEMGNPECMEFIGSLRRLPGDEKLIEQLIQEMEDLNFSQALVTLADLKKK